MLAYPQCSPATAQTYCCTLNTHPPKQHVDSAARPRRPPRQPVEASHPPPPLTCTQPTTLPCRHRPLRSCLPPRLCFGTQCILLNVPPPPSLYAPEAPAAAPEPTPGLVPATEYQTPPATDYPIPPPAPPAPSPGDTVWVGPGGQRVVTMQSDGGTSCECLEGSETCLNSGQCKWLALRLIYISCMHIIRIGCLGRPAASWCWFDQRSQMMGV